MKKYFLIAFAIFYTLGQAQIIRVDSASHWKKSLKTGVNINQASFSSNWKAGGVNSFGFNALLNIKANYKKEKMSWDNELDLIYGMVNNQGQGYRKTMDRIYFDTKYGKAISEKWNMFVALNFRTQFAKGYKYTKDPTGIEISSLISDFLAPAFITTSVGFQYQPSKSFKLRLSPFSPRITIVQNSALYTAVDAVAPYGVLIGETLRYEWLAGQMLAEFNKDIATNINLKWRYLLFANYETLALKTIDHRLELMLNARVNKFITVGLGGILLYDFDQDSGAQLSQVFNLGFAYSFQNYEEPK